MVAHGRDARATCRRRIRLIAIHLNGEKKEIADGLTLTSLLECLKLPADRIAIERNLEIVPRSRWSETRLHEGDKLEVVQFVGGGFDFGFGN